MGMFSLLEMGMFGLLEMGMFSLLEMDMFSLFHFQKFFSKYHVLLRVMNYVIMLVISLLSMFVYLSPLCFMLTLTGHSGQFHLPVLIK